DAEGRGLEDGEGRAAGKGVRRLEPEPPEEDDDRRLLASRAGAADRVPSAPLARGGANSEGRGPGEAPLRDPGRGQASRAGGRPVRARPQAEAEAAENRGALRLTK